MDSKKVLGIVAVLLALLLLFAGGWAFQLKGEKTALMQNNEQLTSELSDMQGLKLGLEKEVDSLTLTYNLLAEVNDSLQSSLTNAKSTINSQSRTIKKLKASNKQQTTKSGTEVSSLKADIQSLLASKANLEASILSLQAENDSLKVRTGVLEKDLSIARKESSELSNLNKSMQKDLDRLTLENFKATAFRVELEKRKPKVTSKSRKAKRIQASFDLTGVPQEYQGVRPVYLVITDETSSPIKLKNPIKASISINGQPTEIIAAEAKEINITNNQRLSFTHELAEKLRPGYYRVMAYTDIGLLGMSSLKLR